MEKSLVIALGISLRRFPANTRHNRSTSTLEVRRLLLIVTTTSLMSMIMSSLPVQASAILPPHVLLKSDTSNIVDGARSTTGGGIRKGRTKGFGSPSMRPSPSEDLPVLPLPPFNNKDSLPTKSDRDPRKLADVLGNDFDAAFMSIRRPRESRTTPNGTYIYDNAMIQTLALSIRLAGFNIPGRLYKVEIRSKKKRQLFQNYLAAYTYCPVHYKWIDLGQRFWPRWIRQGDCSGNDKGVRSCSFPPGMSCKPLKSTSKTVLWWHCQSHGQCQWIPIKYPVITSCKCSC